MPALIRENVVNKTFDCKIASYHEVFQIIGLQQRHKNLLFLQGYPESTVNKSFGFVGFNRLQKLIIRISLRACYCYDNWFACKHWS